MDRRQYPANWEEISRAIRAREGNRCAWCGVPNGAVGVRDPQGYFWILSDDGYYADGSMAAPERLTRIVLTVAHLGAFRGPVVPGQPIPWGSPHDKADCRPENLCALCQKCHLSYDRLDHIKHAAETRYRKKLAKGQMILLDAPSAHEEVQPIDQTVDVSVGELIHAE